MSAHVDTARVDTDRIAAAKLWLTSGHGDLPYLADALYTLHTVSSVETPSMTADDRWRLYVNPGWAAGASVPEIGAQLAHVTWHLLADHAGRARSLHVTSSTASTWRDAADVTVAETLDASGLDGHALPRPADLRLTAGRPAEEHYARLSRLPASPPEALSAPGGAAGGWSGGSSDGSVDARRQAATGDPTDSAHDVCGSSADGLPRTYELPLDSDVPSVGTVQADEVRRRVAIEFRRHVTTRGTQPGEALRWAAAILDPVVPWQQVLTAAVRRAAGWANGHADYTYLRPSRRQFAVRNVLLPGMRRPLPTVAIVVDTSSSVDDGMLGQALGEVDGAITGLGVPGEQVTVLACDAAVSTVQTVRRAKDLRLGGGGGTDMRVGIDRAVRGRPRPDVVIVVTDGYTPWPRQAPAGVALVAALIHRSGTTPPPAPSWARVVTCEMG